MEVWPRVLSADTVRNIPIHNISQRSGRIYGVVVGERIKWKGKRWWPQGEVKWSEVKSLSRVQLLATPWTAGYQAPPSMGFSRQEYWSGLPLPSSGELPGHKVRCLLLRVFRRWGDNNKIWILVQGGDGWGREDKIMEEKRTRKREVGHCVQGAEIT